MKRSFLFYPPAVCVQWGEMVEESVGLIRSLLAAQRFIFQQTADQVWVGRLDTAITTVNVLLDDFNLQMVEDGKDVEEKKEDVSDSDKLGNQSKATKEVTDIEEHDDSMDVNDDKSLEEKIHEKKSDSGIDKASLQLPKMYKVKIKDKIVYKSMILKNVKVEPKSNSENVSREQKEFCRSENANIKKENNSKENANVAALPKVSCSRCPAKFKSTVNLIRHIKENHQVNGKIQCPGENCELICKTRDGLLDHYVSKHDNRDAQFDCPDCGKRFARKSRLNGHVKLYHEVGSQTCDHCLKEFPNVAKLVTHIKGVHNGPKIYSCDICGKVLKYKHSLEMHKAVRHKIGVGEFKCKDCAKYFIHQRLLKTHVLNKHKNFNRYQCDQCEYKVPFKYQPFKTNLWLSWVLQTSLEYTMI